MGFGVVNTLLSAASQEESLTVNSENLTYGEIKQAIRNQLGRTVEAACAIGYYLKRIRDEKLYKEDGYKTMPEMAYDVYGIRNATVTHYVHINDRFSSDGYSLKLAERYTDFSTSKLQEMLYLDDKQVQDVDPKMTVKDIRELRSTKEISISPEPIKQDVEYIPYGKQIGDSSDSLLPNIDNPENKNFSTSKSYQITKEKIEKEKMSRNGKLAFHYDEKSLKMDSSQRISVDNQGEENFSTSKSYQTTDKKIENEKTPRNGENVFSYDEKSLKMDGFQCISVDNQNNENFSTSKSIQTIYIKNTKHLDSVECIYCHHLWDGAKATHCDLSAVVITCPDCGKEMGVLQTVEYECYKLE